MSAPSACSSPGYTARYDELAAWLQDYNDHPDAPAIYRLALARRTPGSAELTPASFVGKAPPSPTFAAARTVTGADAAPRRRAAGAPAAHGRRWRLQRRLRPARPQVDGRPAGPAGSRIVARPHPHPRAGGRFAARRAGAGRGQHAARRQLERRPCRLSPAATWPRPRAASSWWPMRSPDQASSWTLSAGSFWAARANLLAGNPQKFAPYLKRAALHGRTFYGLIAQKALGMRIEPDWNVPRARPRTDRHAAQRPRRPPRAGAAAARRRDGRRARAVRRLDRRRSAVRRGGHGARPEGLAAGSLGAGRQRQLGPAPQHQGL